MLTWLSGNTTCLLSQDHGFRSFSNLITWIYAFKSHTPVFSGTLFVLFFLPETKGKSPEELQVHFRRKKKNKSPAEENYTAEKARKISSGSKISNIISGESWNIIQKLLIMLICHMYFWKTLMKTYSLVKQSLQFT